MHRFHLIDVLWLLFLLQHLNYSCCEEDDLSEMGLNKTYRTPLERTLQRAIGVADFLTSPFRSSSDDESKEESHSIGYGSVLNKFTKDIHAIVPGTRWCGDGNSAVNDSQLGLFRHTDACCREHDKCDFNIGSGKSFANLKNDGLFTRSACECDQTFYDCLKNARNPLSLKIGFTYFNVLRPQCIDSNYPIRPCMERDTSIMNKCVADEYDTSQEKTFQWKDSPSFV